MKNWEIWIGIIVIAFWIASMCFYAKQCVKNHCGKDLNKCGEPRPKEEK